MRWWDSGQSPCLGLIRLGIDNPLHFNPWNNGLIDLGAQQTLKMSSPNLLFSSTAASRAWSANCLNRSHRRKSKSRTGWLDVLITGAVDDAACEAESKRGADVEGKREVPMDYVIFFFFFLNQRLIYRRPNAVRSLSTGHTAYTSIRTLQLSN
jgi:hypothetical protein